MKPSRLGIIMILASTAAAFPMGRAHGGLAEYVAMPDPSFSFEQVSKIESAQGTAYHLKLTSQVWQGITWTHALQVYEPKTYTCRDAMLLLITGGGHDSKPSHQDAEAGFALANLCGARCAILPQVPNQPLLGDKTEDTLIAETFVRYLETRDENWPLLFPMVKSTVRAMDALEAWTQQAKTPPVRKFVVTGASKRGWTTWLTASQDPRIIAIAPMVIDTLNMRRQEKHSREIWGKPSEQIDDYSKRGLLSEEESPERLRLWKMVDPYTYRDQLALPKLLINGTNDRYWTLDALNIYWDDLKGEKSVVYVPNAGHSLETNREYATHGIAALFRHSTQGKPMPRLTWVHSDAPNGALHLTIQTNDQPKSAMVWSARSRTLDFRDSQWSSRLLKAPVKGAINAEIPCPPDQCSALFGDIQYEIDGVSFHLSTQIRQKKGSAVK